MRRTFKNCWKNIQQNCFFCQKDVQTKRLLGIRKHNAKVILRWSESIDIHTHSKQALVQLYFEALRSFFANRKQNKDARPPFRTKKYQTFVWKNTAVKLLEKGVLKLSPGRNSEPIYVPTKLQQGTEIRTAKLVYNGTYKLHITVAPEFEQPPTRR